MSKLQITEKGRGWFDSVSSLKEQLGTGTFSTNPEYFSTLKSIREHPVELSQLRYKNIVKLLVKDKMAIII